MKTTFVTLVSVVSLVFLDQRPLFAQMYETVGTRAQGMAGAFVAVADDATATWWNPAGLVLTYFSAVVDQAETEQPAEPTPGSAESRANTRSFAVAFPALGLSYYHLRISEIAATGSTGAQGAVRQDQGVVGSGVRSTVTDQFGATIGQSIGQHVVLASSLKLVRAGTAVAPIPSLDTADDLEVSQETSGDLDIGVLARFTHARVGLSIKHMNEPSFGEGASAFELSRQIRAGVAWTGFAGRPGALTVITASFDADLTRTATAFGDVRHIAAGGELTLQRMHLAFRGGASANTVGDVSNSASAGVSVGVLRGVFLDGAKTWGSDQSRKAWALGFRLTI